MYSSKESAFQCADSISNLARGFESQGSAVACIRLVCRFPFELVGLPICDQGALFANPIAIRSSRVAGQSLPNLGAERAFAAVRLAEFDMRLKGGF
jgi:hypothetical protein